MAQKVIKEQKIEKATRKKAKTLVHQTMVLLKEEFPSLIYAINLLSKTKNWVETQECAKLSTDGEKLFYHPANIVQDYKDDGYDSLKKQLLHIVLHGLLGHLTKDVLYRDRKLMWVVMDREVEHLIQKLMDSQEEEDEDEYEYGFGYPSGTEGWMQMMDKYLGESYDISCYYKARKDKKIRRKMLSDGHGIRSDNHEMWLQKTSKSSKGLQFVSEDNKKKLGTEEEKQKQQAKRQAIAISWKEVADKIFSNSNHTSENGIPSSTLIYTLQQGKGYGSGSLQVRKNVEAVSENQNSYYDILMEFLKIKDTIKEQPDEIDTMLYHYGLELYGDVPLMESPEETEQLHLNTICLAIDTSGSCDGVIAKRFLRESYNIIRDAGGCSSKGELYFFTCDDELQQEFHYEEIRDIELNEWENIQLKGWGGTSFLPIFDRVDELKREGHTIDGLIYLTDGYGDYPNEQPDYPVYFVMPEEDWYEEDWREDGWFPKWIQYIKLDL